MLGLAVAQLVAAISLHLALAVIRTPAATLCVVLNVPLGLKLIGARGVRPDGSHR